MCCMLCACVVHTYCIWLLPALIRDKENPEGSDILTEMKILGKAGISPSSQLIKHHS